MNIITSATSSSFGATNDSNEFRYVHSCDLKSKWVHVKIGTLEGLALPRLNYEHLLEDPLMKFCGRNQDKYPDLMMEIVVVDGTPPKFGDPKSDLYQSFFELHLPVATSYKHFTKRWEWNEWIQLPLKYSDLPRNAQLCLTIYDCGGSKNETGRNRNVRTAIGGTTISLFGKKGLLRQGQMDLRVWSETAADPGNPTKTPGKQSQINTSTNNKDQLNQNPEFYRLSKLTKKYRSGKIQTVDWIDGLAFAEIEKVISKEKERSNLLFLMIEFPEFRLNSEPHSVIYYEKQDGTGNMTNIEGISQIAGSTTHEYVLQNTAFPPQSDIILLPDSEIEQENLVEAKHHRLARSARAVDTELKPDTAALRNRLNEIADYLPTQNLSAEEQDLVWRYRFYLAANKRALTKFVKCINWQVSKEADQALEHIIKNWVPIDVSDALELLGPTFRHRGLRQYAVNRLKQAQDSDLQLYLLQLVQALKYEPHDNELFKVEMIGNEDLRSGVPSELPVDLGEISVENTIGEELNALTINSDRKYSAGKNTHPQHSPVSSTQLINSPNPGMIEPSKGGLVQFLIGRACKNDVIANYFYWYLVIECEGYCANKIINVEQHEIQPASEAQATSMQEDSKLSSQTQTSKIAPNGLGQLSKEDKVQYMYYRVLQRFKRTMNNGPTEWKERLLFLDRQTNFVNQLVELIKAVKGFPGSRPKKIEKLQALLKSTESNPADETAVGTKSRSKQKGTSTGDKISQSASKFTKFNFMNFSPPLKHPLDPNVIVKGIIPDNATLFKSSLTPARLTFIRDDVNENYVTIFKVGDDLRQDQLILQIITLMDRILKQENLDLKLTPYHVLASSSSHGFVQYVESSTVQEILTAEGSIQNYFRRCNPSENGPYGIHPEVMDTYVKSCAGYCVVTYLLGVGDRHLDNLLLTKVSLNSLNLSMM